MVRIKYWSWALSCLLCVSWIIFPKSQQGDLYNYKSVTENCGRGTKRPGYLNQTTQEHSYMCLLLLGGMFRKINAPISSHMLHFDFIVAQQHLPKPCMVLRHSWPLQVQRLGWVLILWTSRRGSRNLNHIWKATTLGRLTVQAPAPSAWQGDIYSVDFIFLSLIYPFFRWSSSYWPTATNHKSANKENAPGVWSSTSTALCGMELSYLER